jgi:hypothetical protein
LRNFVRLAFQLSGSSIFLTPNQLVNHMFQPVNSTFLSKQIIIRYCNTARNVSVRQPSLTSTAPHLHHHHHHSSPIRYVWACSNLPKYPRSRNYLTRTRGDREHTYIYIYIWLKTRFPFDTRTNRELWKIIWRPHIICKQCKESTHKSHWKWYQDSVETRMSCRRNLDEAQ